MVNKKRSPLYDTMKVSTKTDPSKLAGAIAALVRETLMYEEKHNEYFEEFCELSVIGAGPVNQGFKAVAIADGMVSPKGVNLRIKGVFKDAIVKGEDMTAMIMVIERK